MNGTGIFTCMDGWFLMVRRMVNVGEKNTMLGRTVLTTLTRHLWQSMVRKTWDLRVVEPIHTHKRNHHLLSNHVTRSFWKHGCRLLHLSLTPWSALVAILCQDAVKRKPLSTSEKVERCSSTSMLQPWNSWLGWHLVVMMVISSLVTCSKHLKSNQELYQQHVYTYCMRMSCMEMKST